ncbi:MAG TPA: glycosyltransferase family 4 protein [Gammaproteobacteria bacterium]|nr:glycosyltransferase family 4 protein [Gammaproteobacteria bacterium]
MRRNVLILGHNDATQFIDIYNQYARLFDPASYHITVAYLTGAPNENTRNRTLADEVLFLNIPKKDIRSLKIKAIKQLLSLTRQKKFHTVICHRYKPTYIMLWVAQFCRIPAMVFVMHELGTMASCGRQILMTVFARRNSNMLFAGVSNAVRDDMRNSLWGIPKDRIITLYNVIDITMMEPALQNKQAARKKLGLQEGDFVFGQLARLVPNKDQESLIQAFAEIKKRCPTAKLIILGDGALENKLRQMVTTLQLEDAVIFTGYIDAGFSYMKAFDCFVLSSTQEAFGRVLLEAMIAKIPIIATRTHGIPEVVGNVAHLIQPGNISELATVMEKMYHRTPLERTDLGEIGYQHVSACFSIPAFQKAFWQLPLFEKNHYL